MQQDYIAFAGIGDPERFFKCLAAHGLKVVATMEFADHHTYSKADITKLEQLSITLKAKLITTPKDAVKININDLLVFDAKLKFYGSNEQQILTLLHEELEKNKTFN